MTIFVADAADGGLADAVGWLSSTALEGDELVVLVEPDARPNSLDVEGELMVTPLDDTTTWLPGAGLAVCGTPTARLLELAACSGFDIHVCGPQPGEVAHSLPASPDALASALSGTRCELHPHALRVLFELARDAAGRIVAFDATGFVAAAVAAGASAGGRDRPIIIHTGYRTGLRVQVSGQHEAIEARLASVGALSLVALHHASFAATERIAPDGPIGLLVLPPGADYVDVHTAAGVLARASTIARPLDPASGPGAHLALEELNAVERHTSLAGVVGSIELWMASPDGVPAMAASGPADGCEPPDGGAVSRKTTRETLDTKHFLSGRHIEGFVERHGPNLIGRILDFGCGNKPYTDALPNATTLVGVDVEQSSERCVDVLVQPGEPLPFADCWFDGAICTEVIEHVEEPWTVLQEIGRVVRPGGTIIVSAPFVWPLHEEPRDFMRFSPHALAYLLERAGFEVEVVERAGGFSSVINQLRAERLHGRTDAERARIHELNEDGVRGDREDQVGTIATHFPVLAWRR